jgi:SAM-dependent methyltransferase
MAAERVETNVLPSGADERALLVAAIESSATDGTVRVLEAGCGNHWTLKPQGVRLRVTGIDLDAHAMRIRQEVHGDLDEAIVGDLHDVAIPEATFDVVYCSYVLEHLEDAERVLDRLRAAVRPGGRLVLRMPDRDSVFGWAARHTPHRTHVWFKRYVERQKDAGKPGHAPYPVVYDEVVSVRGMRDWSARHGLTVETEYASNQFIRSFGPLGPLVQQLLNVVSRLSGGRLSAGWNNIGYVLVV